MSVNVLSNENRGKQIEDIFQSAYQEIIDQVLADQQEVSQLAEAKKWLEKAIHYNIRNGKRNRAKSLFSTFELIAPELTKENVREACMLGWCIELLQAYFLIVDDIMDVSITRRGQLCWYRQVCTLVSLSRSSFHIDYVRTGWCGHDRHQRCHHGQQQFVPHTQEEL